MAKARKTQKDVDKYEAKLFGPFTVKQAIALGIGAAVIWLLFTFLTSLNLDMSIKVTACVFVFAPFALVAYWKPYGMSLITYLRTYYEYHFLSTKERQLSAPTLDTEIKSEEEMKAPTKYVHKRDKKIKDYE